MTLTSKPRLIGLYADAMQSGKTTVALHLVDNHGYELIRFAGPLKRMTQTLLMEAGLSRAKAAQHINGDLKEEPIPELNHRTARFIMQRLGTEFGRELIADDVWVQMAARKIERALDKGLNVVVDDMRFANEADIITDHGGILVKVDRGFTPAAQHASEGGLYQVRPDVIIENFGSLEALRAAVDQVVWT